MEAKERKRRRRTQAASSCAYVEPEAGARPMRALLLHLQQEEPSPFGRERIAHHAETTVRVLQLGLGAIGHLLARSAVHVEDQSIPSECMESLGTLMAELSDLAAVCHQLATERHAPETPATLIQEPGK